MTIKIIEVFIGVWLLCGGGFGTWITFETLPKTWQGLRSNNDLAKIQAKDQLFCSGMSLLGLGLAAFIFL